MSLSRLLANSRLQRQRPILPPLSPPPPPPAKSRRGPLIVTGLFIYALSAYSFYIYTTIASAESSLEQDADVSSRFDVTAPTYDSTVSISETLTGIRFLRWRLVRKARGDVLEASAGTGRNGKYYDERKCRSWTFVDRSKEMLDIARTKFKKEHPAYRAAATFLAQSVLDPLPVLEEDSNPKDERHRPPPGNSDSRIRQRQPHVYTTVVQTMGLCSTPQPAALLARLGDLADANGGRVLLLEHGRSYYGWMNALLDRTAGVHAERHGCWWNRDIGKLIEESGLEVVKVKRWHFGTTWWVELKGRGKGGGREGKGGEEMGREEGPWGRGGEKESGGK